MDIKLPFYRFLLIGMMSLFVNGLFAQTDWAGQTWVGLHQIDYRDRTESTKSTQVEAMGRTILITESFRDYVRSAGVHVRHFSKNAGYQQFDLAYGKTIVEELTTTQIVGQPVIEPTRGERIEVETYNVGYRRGKLYPLRNKFSGDIGLGVLAGWSKMNTVPLTSAGFPVRQRGLRTALDFHVGLNYQLHERVNIGYSIVPVTFDTYVYRQTLENPVLTESQKTSNGTSFDVITFPEVVGWGNFRVSYVVGE